MSDNIKVKEYDGDYNPPEYLMVIESDDHTIRISFDGYAFDDGTLKLVKGERLVAMIEEVDIEVVNEISEVFRR